MLLVTCLGACYFLTVLHRQLLGIALLQNRPEQQVPAAVLKSLEDQLVLLPQMSSSRLFCRRWTLWRPSS